jgi:hypothetical protein
VSRDRLWPLGLYAALSLILFGIPVLGDPAHRIIASDPVDSSQFMWFFAWWPHALLHGLNPFVTHAIFYPDGFNLTWSTAMPGPSVVLAPITLAFGPAVTWNVIQLCSPALSAWTAYLLCRHVTRRLWPSLIGGYLFGFSPYMLVHLTGGPYLALVPLVPLMVLLVLKAIEGSIGSRAFVISMAVVMAAQYLISSEVLATSTVFGAFALILAFGFYPERRGALIRVVKLLTTAYLGTAIVISPFLYYFFFGHQYPPGAIGFEADLTSFVIPPHLTAIKLHGGAPPVGSNLESYLGLPLIALLAVVLWRSRRERIIQLLGLFLAAAVLAALGTRLIVHGSKTGIWLPWDLFHRLPVLRYAIPVRFALFITLPAAVIAAIGLGGRERQLLGRSGWPLWALAALSVAFILPAVGNSAWDTHISDPPFFQHGAYKAYLRSSDHVLTVPVWGENERWIADAKFPFAITAGYAGNPFPASFTRYPTYETLLTGRLTPDYAAQLRRFIADKRVSAIVVADGYRGPWRRLFGSLGIRPVSTGGVLVYRLRPSP